MENTPLNEDIIREALQECYDPEIPINIVDLGLVYGINLDAEGQVRLVMTLTAIGCPEAENVLAAVRERVEQIPGVTACDIDLVWEPAWRPELATPEGRVMLRMMGMG
ncbi:MAG TPA: iron-sulfur cluster assembly protein [Armatimonadota bacterium]|nr:iron-sulfur cluster assembly protein [Armatimonadota bacterium]